MSGEQAAQLAFAHQQLRTLGALATTSNSYLRAAASVALGMLALGERPDASSTAGLVLVVAGVTTLIGRPARE